MLFQIGIKLGTNPSLIATRLLSEDDKQDMLNGLISQNDLEIAVKAWMENKMPDYAKGSTKPYKRNLIPR